jgi:hypothetical protein
VSFATVEVRAPSQLKEGARVLGLAFVITAIALGSIWIRRSNAAGREGKGGERAFAELSAADQRTVNGLREALIEAENIRAQNLVWSSVQALAERGVPPFASDPISGDPHRWTFLREKSFVNYLGLPKPGTNQAAFLLLIAETEEGGTVLGDGTSVQVSIWTRSGGSDPSPDRIISAPESEGWTRIADGGAR